MDQVLIKMIKTDTVRLVKGMYIKEKKESGRLKFRVYKKRLKNIQHLYLY